MVMLWLLVPDREQVSVSARVLMSATVMVFDRSQEKVLGVLLVTVTLLVSVMVMLTSLVTVTVTTMVSVAAANVCLRCSYKPAVRSRQ